MGVFLNSYFYQSPAIVPTTWTGTTLSSYLYWRSITYGNGRFVAVAENTNIAAYSDDGINWIQTILPSSLRWIIVTYGNGRFVAVALETNIAAYSDDGINWTQFSILSGIDWRSITYGNGRFVAVGRSTIGQYGRILYSNNGTNWTMASQFNSTQGTDDIYSVTYGNGKFVAVGENNFSFYSDDNGITWNNLYINLSRRSWKSITYGNGRFVAVATNSNNVIHIDDDGFELFNAPWNSQAIMPISSQWELVNFGNDRFVAISRVGSIAAYSTNGITWTLVEMPKYQYNIELGIEVNGTWISSTYGNGRFVAISYNMASEQTNFAAYSNII